MVLLSAGSGKRHCHASDEGWIAVSQASKERGSRPDFVDRLASSEASRSLLRGSAMSSYLLVARFAKGVPVPIDADEFEAVFGPCTIHSGGNFRTLRVADGTADVHFAPGEDCITFSRFSGPGFAALLLDYLRRTSTVVLCPDAGPAGAVGHAEALLDLPGDVMASASPAVIADVSDLHDLLKVWAAAEPPGERPSGPPGRLH